MTIFELVFWPLWLFSIWLFQDERMIRIQCWMADRNLELTQQALAATQKGVE